jgi:alpha-amylase/alpha-mannosidase (GH57 family)
VSDGVVSDKNDKKELYVCMHGHFYQPPRQNPWLEEIEAEESAAPFHDWNERINAECYAPNAAARIVDGEGGLLEIVNNFEHISFNFGPTLLAWLEKVDPSTYLRIIAADHASRTTREGHGNAIAQAYNHIIMPLANHRDKVTQVVWGMRDFHARFGRASEGMWLPETAVDLETLDILAEHGMRFTILSPFQAKRVRVSGNTAWHNVANGSIDPSRPYRCHLPSGREITLFFYDAPVAKAIAFDGVLARGEMLIERLMGGFHPERQHEQLMHVATDGETYGHHHRFGEMALAYALGTIAHKGLAKLTNYGQYLGRVPAEDIVEIYENSSWSCAHGVERWRSDCGCQTGGQPGWHQRWRQPLREALDWLRDRLVHLFEDKGRKLLIDPWAARNGYITVILDRSRGSIESFFQQYAHHRLSDAEVIHALKLLEMQRHALLMYTSCAWFFAEISGIETVQMLVYAARAIQLAQEVDGLALEAGFFERLAAAPSNLPQLTKNGRDVYLKLVKPSVATLRTVIADHGINALVDSGLQEHRLGVYAIQATGAHQQTRASLTLATGRVHVHSEITGESLQAIYAVLGSDGQDFRCSVKGYVDVEEYSLIRDELFQLFMQHSLTAVVRALDAHFGEDYFTLRHLFRAEQRRLAQTLLEQGLQRLTQEFPEIYRANQWLMHFLQEKKLPIPDVLRLAAESTFNAELQRAVQQFSAGQLALGEVLEVTRTRQAEATRLQCRLDLEALRRSLEGLITQHVMALPHDMGHAQIPHRVLEAAQELNLGLNLWQAQNLFWQFLQGPTTPTDLPVVLELGTRLGFNQAVVRKLLYANSSPLSPALPSGGSAAT